MTPRQAAALAGATALRATRAARESDGGALWAAVEQVRGDLSRLSSGLSDLTAALDDKADLETLDTKADANHAHAQYATLSQLGAKADVDHTHDYVTPDRMTAALGRKADQSFANALQRDIQQRSRLGHGHDEYVTREAVAALIAEQMPEVADGQTPRLETQRHINSIWLRWWTGETASEWIKVPRFDGINPPKPQELTVPFDDYADTEYLPEQSGDGTVKTFTFSAPVQLMAVEMVSTLDEATQQNEIDAQEGRATVGDTQPTATVGAILKHEQEKMLFGNTNAVHVLAPANTRINVYGMRRG